MSPTRTTVRENCRSHTELIQNQSLYTISNGKASIKTHRKKSFSLHKGESHKTRQIIVLDAHSNLGTIEICKNKDDTCQGIQSSPI